jgi:hypothetical protein
MKNIDDREKDIEDMERIMNDMRKTTNRLDEVCDEWERLMPEFERLMRYYGSEEWHSDVEAQESGQFSEGLRCGVLSEDGVYNLYADVRRVGLRLAKLGIMALEDFR